MNVDSITITNQKNTDDLQKLKQLSKDFEAIFIDIMLKTMKIGEDSTLGNSAENSIYQSMYQNALANQIANTSSFGIASLAFNALKKTVEDAKAPKIQKPIPLNQNNYIPFKVNLPKDILDTVKKASAAFKVPEKLILSVIKAESNFNTNAISPKGAMGLMQLMPETAQSLGVTNAFDPVQNIMAGTKYLSNLIQNLQSVPLALAAYNAGLGNVKKFDGIPPFKETVQYIQKVISYYEKA
ncbi:Membrane-bound lytic murein transglycosylase D precursor [Desulfurella amilsii]|uniref:Membrane-bound lytic murein transglycosylase D n=1 Tax=Desulfurella amilsii TaxID=1562698 RepID=A0A1X4XX90_9BACT|nr:transglycosylase SLT domain-containing protein [Desulfurella amilsii]OSS42151.1 Membrane-bound lytic murein transglycosylase D precursor [Desulfurella amilsii]